MDSMETHFCLSKTSKVIFLALYAHQGCIYLNAVKSNIVKY